MSWLIKDDTLTSRSEFMLEIMESLGKKRNEYDARLNEVVSTRAAGHHRISLSYDEELAGSADAYTNILSFMLSTLDDNSELVTLLLTKNFIQQKCAELVLMYDIVNESTSVDEDDEIPTYQVFLHESYSWIGSGITSAINLLEQYEDTARP